MTLKSRDARVLGRDEPARGLEVARTRGAYVYDTAGKRYIDFYPGWCVGNIGWGRREIDAAIRRGRRADYVMPGFLYKPWVELAELLSEITPGRGRKRVFRATGGTEAVELALQIAMSVTRRHKFLSIEGSYHGNSLGALSVAASETRERFKNLLPNCRKIDCPLDGKAADRAEAILKRRDTAAFIMEPVICNLGVHVPTPLFMTRMQALCRKYGTLLVMDEVATGFGRTGRLFASEHFGLEPDILCLAKAVTGGYAPLGAAVVRGAVADAIDDRFSFYSTFGWHPVSVAAALASSRYFVAHREEILTNVNRLSDYFGTRLSAMKFEGLTALNIAGLAIALEFEDDDAAERIADRCRRKGLLVSDEGGDLMLLPALTMDRATARRGLDILEASL